MTKTNLAYIEEASVSVLDSPLKLVKKIGGFQIETTKEVGEKAANTYRNDARYLKTTLEQANIKPLAVLPRAWWEKILDEAGLYRIESTLDTASISISDDDMRHVKKVNFIFRAGLLAITTVSFIIASIFLLGPLGAVAFGVAVSVFLTPIAMGLLIDFVLNKYLIRLAVRLCLSEKKIRGMISFPSGSYSYSWDARLRFRLPIPPREFGETLIKLESIGFLHKTFFGVDWSAFSFEENPRDWIVRKVARDIRQRRREFLDTLADPICYVSHGSAVAVVGQFGDFPIEKEVVDRVTGQYL